MRRVLSSSLLFTAAMLCFGAHRAQATTITSSTFANWKTSLTGSPTEADFTKISYVSYSTSSGISLPSTGNSSLVFTFTGPDGSNWTLNGVKYNNFTSLEGGSDSSAAIKIALPGSGDNAILLGLASVSNTPITVTLSDGETFTVTSNGLLGLSISHLITSVTVSTTSGSEAVINDFWYGTSSLAQDTSGSGNASATPECATMLLIAGGLLVVVGANRKFNDPPPNSAV
jgi:hypothetical protein